MKAFLKNTLRQPEFPLFPHFLWRPNPRLLNIPLLSKYDPWAKRDNWRYHEFFSVKNRLKAAFPGLGIAAVLLAIYIGLDQYSLAYGPQSVEKKEWEEWLKERNSKLKNH